jgi:hypothetical protein
MGVKGFSGILHGGITGPESGLNAGRDHGFTVESRATGHSDQLDGGGPIPILRAIQYSHSMVRITAFSLHSFHPGCFGISHLICLFIRR